LKQSGKREGKERREKRKEQSKMKKMTLALFIIIGCLTFYSDTVQATNSDTAQETSNHRYFESEIGISFKSADPIKTSPSPIVKEPLLPIEGNPPKSIGRLPSTGELITSLIWTLIGCSVFIVFIGVYSLKNIMMKLSWE
jgi:hypothetical protein